jgi:hypothetical protein
MALVSGFGRGYWGEEGFGSVIPVKPTQAVNAWNEGAWGDVGFGGVSRSVTAVGQVGSARVRESALVNVTGLEATSGLNNVTILTDQNIPQTGLSATGGVGSPTVTGTALVNNVTGLSTTSGVGSVSVLEGSGVTVPFGGWGRGSWGQGSWGVSLGVSATGQVGQVTHSGGAVVPTTGLEATTNVGSVTVTGGTGIDVPVTAPQMTGVAGQLAMIGDANVYPDGIAPNGEVGQVTAKGIARIFVSGLSATGEVTRPAVEGDAVVSVTGLVTSGTVGSVLVWSNIDPDATVVWTEIAA